MGLRGRSKVAGLTAGALVLAGLCAAPAAAFAKTLWVGGTGCSDTGSGTSAQPYCTIQAAAAAATADTMVLVNPGTYTGPVNVTSSGGSGAYITFSSVKQGAATISGGTNGFVVNGQSYVSIAGFTISGTTGAGITAGNSDHLIVMADTVTSSGHPVHGQTAPGISLTGVTNSTIRDNHADGNSSHGIVLGAGSTGNSVLHNEASTNAQGWLRGADGIQIAGSGNTITDNTVHDNEQSGIHLLQGADSSKIGQNIAYNNGDHGIDAVNVAGAAIGENTVYRNCTSGIALEGTSSNATIKDNIAVDNAVYPAYKGISCARRTGNIGVYDSAASGTVVDRNVVNLTAAGTEYAWAAATYSTLTAFQAASGQGAHDIAADPKFANAAGWNLHLTEGSPAIDSGDQSAAGATDTDAEGLARVDDPNVANTGAGTRAYDDRGAYEFQPAQSGPTAALSLSATSGIAPLTVQVGAFGSTPGSSAIASFTFDFGDGTAAVGPQARGNAQHVYVSAGTYTVKLTATDTAGRVGTTTGTVTVTAAGPTAVLTASPASGPGPLTTTLDATKSTPGASPIASYDFAFGDGSPDVIQNGTTSTPVSHTYAGGHSYTATVTVKDSAGRTGLASQTITAAAVAPTAALTVSPSTGAPPLQVTANASASLPGSSPIATYTFSFGDGSAAVGPQAGATATHSYTAAGVYTVKVTAADAQGVSSTATSTVTVTGLSAALTLSTLAGNAPLTLTADASASRAGANAITSYTFDFGDGSAAVGPQSPATAAHTYTKAGTFTVTVTVKDSGGAASTATKTVTVVTVGPAAALSLSTQNGAAPLPVTADASGSSAGSAPIVSYTFDFGDGSAAVGPQVGATATHSYTAAGTYTVKVTVTDTGGQSSTATQTEVVTAHAAPIAAVSATPSTGAAPMQVVADATNSTSGSSPIATYTFDFGDGSAVVGPQSAPTTNHTYTAVGNYTLKVTVADTTGASDTSTTTVGVFTPPTAAVVMTPASGSPPLAVVADASTSSAGSGPIVSYSFDFGDGSATAKVGPQPEATAKHTYAALGTYTVTVTATDSNDLTSTATAQVIVGNAPPVAALAVTPVSGVAPLAVTADASGTTPGTSTSLAYTFDFGDGSAKVGPQSSATAAHTYASPGSYSITVTVTDGNGLSSTATKQVSAVAPAPPTAVLVLSPASGPAPLAVTADASGSQPGTAAISSYRFDFGDGSAAVGPQAGSSAAHSYTAAGSYTVTLTVTDTAGATATTTKTVTVNPPATGPSAALTVTPASGSAPLNVTADASGSTAGTSSTLSYTFDFGDGSAKAGPQSAATATHGYSAAGTFTVTVTVTDGNNLTSSATKTVTVSAPTGSTLYVGGSGCSETGTGTAAQPFCTIGKAASTATAGWTVIVNPGTYTEQVTVANSGTASSPVAFKANGAVTVTGGANGFLVSNKSYVTITGFTVTATTANGIQLTGSDHITLTGDTITNAGQPTSGHTAYGVQLTATNNSTLTGNHADSNTDHGFYLTNGSTGNLLQNNEASHNARGWERAANGINTVAPANTFVGNVLHDNEDSGMNVYAGADNSVVADNVAYDNGDHGLDNNGASGVFLIGNTVYYNCTDGINVEGTSSNYTVENNISMDNAVNTSCAHGPAGADHAGRAGEIGIYDTATSGTVVDDNLVYSTSGTDKLYNWGANGYTTLAAFQTGSGQGAHDLVGRPGFVSAASGDFHLTEGSPAIDSADSGVTGEQSTDADGKPRSNDPNVADTGRGPRAYDDRGAYEYQTGGVVAGPTAALTVTPASGTAPLAVTADASASTAGSAAISSYKFDFGDGTSVVGPQAGATASHTYSGAGTFTVTVTVTDANGKTASATKQVSVSAAAAIAYVGRTGVTSATGTALTTAQVSVASAVRAGDALLIAVMLTSTSPGSFQAVDNRSNSYAIVSDVTDASKHRTLVLAAYHVNALSVGDTINLTFQSSSKYNVSVDEFSGIGSLDGQTTNSGPASGTTFSTPAVTTGSASELLFAAVGSNSGTAPVFDSGWQAQPAVALSSYRLTVAYRIVTATGSYSVSGTTTSQWGAALDAFR